MRYLFLFFVFLGSVHSFTLKFSKDFTLFIEPDRLSVDLIINVHANNEKRVLDILNKYSDFINNLKEVQKEGGKYSIQPLYKYNNGNRYKDGYMAVMRYKVYSKDQNDLRSFIYKIEEKKEFSKNIDIKISDISWTISQKFRVDKTESLRNSSIKWAINYAKELGSDINSSCRLKNITFNSNNFHQPMPMLRDMSMKRIAPAPIKKDLNIHLIENIEVECQ